MSGRSSQGDVLGSMTTIIDRVLKHNTHVRFGTHPSPRVFRANEDVSFVTFVNNLPRAHAVRA